MAVAPANQAVAGFIESRAALFKALSEPARLRIVALLLHAGECCVCDLVEVLELPQSMVSRHLAYLRNAGVVAARREGAWMFYRLSDCSDALQGALRDLLATHLPSDLIHAADREAFARRTGVCG